MTKICIAAPYRDSYSETFIRRHIDELPFATLPLCGDALRQIVSLRPFRRCDPRYLISRSTFQLGLRTETSFLETQMIWFLKALKIRAVLAEYGTTAVQWMNACSRTGVPLIAHFHGFDATRHVTLEAHRENYPQLFGKAAAIVGVSRAMCDQLRQLGASEENLHYVPYSVNEALFERVTPHLNPPRFLAAGRFVEKKAPHLTILAFRNTLQGCPDAHLDMIGDGPFLPCCRQLVRGLKLSDNVSFHGWQDHIAVYSAMKNARCFLQHSIQAVDGDSEGTPVAILEAQCCGLPVVATRHAGIPDVVVDGETGFLVDEQDVDGMSTAMNLLCENPDLCQTMSVNAADRFRQYFGHQQTLGKLASIIRDCVV